MISLLTQGNQFPWFNLYDKGLRRDGVKDFKIMKISNIKGHVAKHL